MLVVEIIVMPHEEGEPRCSNENRKGVAQEGKAKQRARMHTRSDRMGFRYQPMPVPV